MISWLHTYFVHCSWPHLATASYNSYDTQYGLLRLLNIHGQAWLPVWATVVQYYRPLHCNKIIKLIQTFGTPLARLYIYCLKLVVWTNLALIFLTVQALLAHNSWRNSVHYQVHQIHYPEAWISAYALTARYTHFSPQKIRLLVCFLSLIKYVARENTSA